MTTRPTEQEQGEGPELIEVPVSIYEQIARSTGEPDYETYWERQFEHNTSDHSYRLAATQLGQALRELEEDRPRWRAENLVREAFMRRRIETCDRGREQAREDRRDRGGVSCPGHVGRVSGNDG